MADVDVYDDESRVAVQSRVSWGALLAGAAVGVAIYTVLALLGVAVGLTTADGSDLRDVGTAAGIWAFVSLVIAMFFAGWVTTMCTVGETRTEAVLYGVVVWAVTATLLMWMAAEGVRVGREIMQNAGPSNATASQETTNEVPNQSNASADNDQDGDPQIAAWWSFFGTAISLVAAIGGAMLGPYEFVARRAPRRRVVSGVND
jgi:hypothetical protein